MQASTDHIAENQEQTLTAALHKPSTTKTQFLWRGFQDEVVESQRCFRKIMKAMSEPGQLVSLEALDTSDNISSASFSVALTLIDQDISVWVSPQLSTTAFLENLRFYCGCSLVSSPSEADFVFIKLAEWQDLNSFKQGSEEYPDRFPTLILEAEHLAESGDIELKGPGIKESRQVTVKGLNNGHLSLIKSNQQNFPMGYDFIFTCGEQLMALPRTTQVAKSHAERASVAGIQSGDSSCM
ncbi:phosphonate C-P lyase system protein PhnH [Alkalimarinus coralli]|uniref:phosphonate C-P lyase system protein PhnH n=1 Tax=Alkalimarinus coralli TaxID=2935863 RepID=UPI00202B3E56|nr:phosphonate C-P lyase system protein PhnH [Alkalimarinus coralli]